MFQFDEQVNPGTSTEIDEFLDREWDRWHADQGHDPSTDWSGRTMQIVARDSEGAIAGVANGRIAAGIGYLGELMIARSQRGNGIGSELVRRFEDCSIDSGCHKLTVITDHESDAHTFYRRLGWTDEAVFRRDRGGRDFVRLYKFIDDQADSRREVT